MPPEELKSITFPWLFAQWGIDLVGLMPSKGGTKFIVVAVNYFTKWADVEALATTTMQKITRFIWKTIVCRFGIHQSIISDNGKQFDSDHYRK